LNAKIVSTYSTIIESYSGFAPAVSLRIEHFIAEFCVLINNPQILSVIFPSRKEEIEQPYIPREIKTLVDLQQAFLTRIPSSNLLPNSSDPLDTLCGIKMEIDWRKALERQAVDAMVAGDLDRSEALFGSLGRCSGLKNDRKRIEMARLLEEMGKARASGNFLLPVAELVQLLNGVYLFVC
jgi:hypothetical protein